MRTLGIIPARAGSKRLPGKNVRPLGGRPLVGYALAAAAAARLLTEVVVTSDDAAVLDVATAYPNIHRILRPAALSTDTAPAISYVRHALEWMDRRGHAPFEATVIVQPTSPFTLADDIDTTIRLLAEDAGADAAVSVTEIPHDLNPIKMKRLRDGLLEPYFEPEAGRIANHELPKIYVRNGSVYVSRVATIAAGSITGRRCRAHLMPRERSHDINDAFDWAVAELLLKNRPA